MTDALAKDPCIASALRDAARRASEAYDAALAGSGLKVTQYRALALIALAEAPPSISDLARAMGLDRSTLGRNLRILERCGLLDFEGGEDERARHAALTPAGRAALDAARPLWAEAQASLRAALTPAEADRLLSLLARVPQDPPPPA
ncbi:MAG: MarR family winged helix-turn-helix transcriptional regulator [Pseudomonadota bacterium]